jgi:hypothetical protein
MFTSMVTVVTSGRCNCKRFLHPFLYCLDIFKQTLIIYKKVIKLFSLWKTKRSEEHLKCLKSEGQWRDKRKTVVQRLWTLNEGNNCHGEPMWIHCGSHFLRFLEPLVTPRFIFRRSSKATYSWGAQFGGLSYSCVCIHLKYDQDDKDCSSNRKQSLMEIIGS